MYRHNKRRQIYLSDRIHPQTLSVVQTRATDLDLEVIIGPIEKANLESREISGILIQYPDTYGNVIDHTEITQRARKNGVFSNYFKYLFLKCILINNPIIYI